MEKLYGEFVRCIINDFVLTTGAVLISAPTTVQTAPKKVVCVIVHASLTGFLPEIFFMGAEYIVMLISFVMLIYFFGAGGAKVFEGLSLPPVEESLV